MNRSDHQLARLLASLLPLERVGPHLRVALRRALASGDHERMVRVGRVVAGELLRRGILVRVAVEPHTGSGGPYVLQKDSSRLLDLAPLGYRPRRAPLTSGAARPSPPRTPTSEPQNATGSETLRAAQLNDLLVAMENAQNLDIGDPESGDKGVILDGILDLLSRLTPGLHLFILLTGDESPDTARGRVRAAPARAGVQGPYWLMRRKPDRAAWLHSWRELPLPIQKAAGSAGWPTDKPDEAAFGAAVAVPLREPAWNETADATAAKEAGLLFVLTDQAWERETLLRLARRLADFVTRRWRHQHEVNQRIHTDSLTDVYNRAYFDSQFPLELERAKRRGSPLTLVLADLDRFKRVNDRFGHQVGDRVLRRVARCLQDELRRIDQICRIGGEEFALILPHTSQSAAHEVMTRLLEREIAVELKEAGKSRRVVVTLSYGAVTFPEAGADAFELYRKADDLLYASKNAGRNRCHFWDPGGEHSSLLGHRAHT